LERKINRMNRLKALTQRLAPVWAIKSGFLALVITAVVASLATAGDSGHGPDRDHGHAPQIEGSWFQTIQSIDPAGPTQALVSFAKGGVIIASANVSSLGTLHGTWTRKGDREFTWTSLSLGLDPTGVHVVTFRVHDELKLARDGQSYRGHGKVELLSPDGNLITELPPTTVHAVRINAE
jgi:hypothetical protein